MTFDATQFEDLAQNFYTNTNIGEQARATIMRICCDPSSIIQFYSLLLQATSHEARFLCLSILVANIQNSWCVLNDQQKDQFKQDVFNLLFHWAKNDIPLNLLRELDNVLVQILLVEWPQNWPSFLHNFIFAAKNSPPEMLNAVYLLGLFSEQVRNAPLLSSRKNELTAALYDNFQMIYSFIKITFTTGDQNIQIGSLITLSEYFQWIDLKIISTDKICDIILGQLMPNRIFRPAVLKCIISIVSRETVIASPSIIKLFQDLIIAVSNELSMLEDPELIPLFVEVFSKFICLDRCALMPNDTVTQWMIEYTKIVDDDLLSIIISMWHNLTKCYIFDTQSLPFSSQFLIPLQYIICSRMAKPVEFGGDRSFYEECSETLILLFKMHRAQILSVIVQKLDVTIFEPDLLPWIFSVGAVSGVCEPDEERSLISTIFGILLRLSQNGENDLGTLSASFFFIAGQYTRYLINDPQTLDLALKMIMDTFMMDDMKLKFIALHSFKKIAIGCGPILIKNGFAQRLFMDFNNLILQIPQEFQLTFFEGISHIVRHCSDEKQKRSMIISLFEKANTVEILTELIPIVNEPFRQPLEGLIKNIFPQFIQIENDSEEKEALFELFRTFLEVFPNTDLLNDFIQILTNDYQKYTSALALKCLATIVNNGNKELIPMLFNTIVIPTYQNLENNFVDHPDVRLNFFILVESFFNFFTFLDTEAISTLFNYAFFGLKHPQPDISEISMNCISNALSLLDKNYNKSPEDSEFIIGFYQVFYERLLSELISLLFDGLHSSLFSQITHTIGHLLNIAASGKISMFTHDQIVQIVFKKLHTLFPVYNEEEIVLVSNDIVNSAGNNGKLRQVLSDFVIASKQLPGNTCNLEDDLLELKEISPASIELEFLKSIAEDDNGHLVPNDSDYAE